jgi:hypothetical protein
VNRNSYELLVLDQDSCERLVLDHDSCERLVLDYDLCELLVRGQNSGFTHKFKTICMILVKINRNQENSYNFSSGY